MNWMVLALVLVGWPLLGLGVAYLFGRFIQGVDTPDNADGLVPSVVSYLRRSKRPKSDTPSRALSPARARREASGGQRLH